MAVNNTRSITAGSQIAGQTVGKEVRRYEYRSSGMSDARMKVVRNAVYRKMLTYAAEDLVNIITQYGDASEIKPGSDKDLLAQLATEVLIINMDPNELKAIVDSVQTAENNLRNDIHQIEKKSKRNLSNHLTKHKNDKFERKITKENNKRIEKMAKDLKVHKSVRRGLPKLRNELNKVLDDFTNMQIQYYAQRMGIEIYDGIPIKEIKKAIVDNVVTYALVVQNKLSISFGTALQDPSACEELLGYTPYYYLNGNPNAYAPGEWMVKREAAKIAKASADERNRLAGKKKVSKKAIRNITGGAETAKDIKAGDTGPLAEMNETQILTLAGEYGIIVDKKSKVEDIKLQIYKKMAIQNKRIKKLQKQADKGGFYNDANSKLAVHSAITGLLDNTAISGGVAGGVPVISVNKDGITSLEVDKAVPVVVVGYGAGGTQKVGYAKDAKKQRENLALGILGKTQKVKLSDLSDMEINMYYDMKSASDPRARMTAYRRNKYSVDDNERQKVYAMFNDDSWGALYILSYMYGYTKLRAYIEQETGISVRVATRRK